MIRSSFFAPLVLLAVSTAAWGLSASLLPAATSVLNYHNDLRSTGQNLTETQLTPSTVKYANFGKIFAAAVDGQVYAQPLYVPALPLTAGSFSGTTHDTVFVCTQHNTVYALDAASGTPLWTKSLMDTAGGETTEPASESGTTDINLEIGVVGTPVIDAVANPTTQKRYLYVVGKSKLVINNTPHYYQRLHALDIASGAERAGSPVVIAETAYNSNGTYSYISGPSVLGTGAGTISGTVGFNALRENQRTALSIYGGKIYIAFASHGDNGPYHGWVLGYNATTLQPTAACNISPNSYCGGIWMAGGGIVFDAAGALYVITGNGGFANVGSNTEPVPGDFDDDGFPKNHCYGDSLVKLVEDSSTAAAPNPNGWGLKVSDYFTPSNQKTLNLGDTDYGSGGAVVLPDSVGSAAHPHLIVSAGKEGSIYLVDRENMGKFRGGITGTGANAAFVSSGDAIVQSSAPNTVFGSLGTPAYFNRQIYFAGAYGADHGKAFTLTNGLFNFTPSSMTPDTFGYLGSTPSVSASSSTTNGIVWCIDRGSNQLRAYDASDLSNELYTSGQAPNSRDPLGTAVKFGVATVADGRVFIGTSESAGPSALVSYGLLTATTTPPAQPQNLYAQTVSGGEIDLFWDDNANNETGYEVYVSLDPANFPATPRLTTAIDGMAAIINGLQASTTYYFRVRAVNSVGNSAYSNISATTSDVAPPVDFSSGFANAGNLITANGFGTGTSAIVGTVLRITDKNANQGHAVWLNTIQNITQFTTEFTFLLTQPDADGFTFCLQNAGLNALGLSGGSLGYETIGNSAAIKFDLYPTGSTTGLYYNGVAPNDSTTSSATSSGSIDVTAAGIDFHNGHTFRVILNYDGTTLTQIITDLTTRLTYTKAYTVNLASVIGNSKAYIGFTGGTGGLTAQQDIQSWSFGNSPPTTPLAPNGLNAAAASGTQVNLAWNNPATNETSTRVERATGSGAFNIIGSVGADRSTYVDSSLATQTTYKYRVVASDNGIDSAPSNVATITTPVPPVTPSGATPTLVSANEIDFTWRDNSTNETGFRILRSMNETEYRILASLPANTTTYKDTTVTGSTSYSYHIQAYNAAGYVDFTGFAAVTPAAVNIVTGQTSVQEGSTTSATITIRRTVATEAGLTVNYKISTGSGQAKYGTRYTLSPAPTNSTTGSVNIPPGGVAVTILVNAIDDGAITGPQSVTITLDSGAGYMPLGSTSATVTVLDTPINEWRVKNFGVANAQSPRAADAADYDNDGLSNLLEYALGSNPLTNSASRVPIVAIETIGGNKYLVLSYYTPRPMPTDIRYSPQYATSSAMNSWGLSTLVTGYPQDLHNGYYLVKFRSPMVITNTSAPGYMRLVIIKR